MSNESVDVKTFGFTQLYKHLRRPDASIISHGLLKQGSMMVVGGPPKAYKSFILLSIATSLCIGKNLFSAHRSPHGRTEPVFVIQRPHRVLLFEQEIGEDDLEDRIAPWYETLSPSQQLLFASNFFSHSLDHDLSFDKAEGMLKLESIIRKVKPEVVIFDPLIEFHASDENSSTAMSAVLKNFTKLCRRTSVTPILSHHEGKEGDSPRAGGDRLRGTSAVYGKGDTFLNLTTVNRNAMRIKIEFTLRRGKPIKDAMIRIDPDTLESQFLCWAGDKLWRKYSNPLDEPAPLADLETPNTKQ